MQKLAMNTLLVEGVLIFFLEVKCFGSIIRVTSVERKIYSNMENVEG